MSVSYAARLLHAVRGGCALIVGVPALAVVSTAGAAYAGGPAPFLTTDGPHLVTVDYGFTGEEQSFRVPSGVTEITVSATGGAGGDAGVPGDTDTPVNSGGRAATVTGSLAVTPGDLFLVRVGGDGGNSAAFGAGGWNGGGTGTSMSVASGGGGGGATDLRTCAADTNGCDPLGSRLLVAGGGGGAGAAESSICPAVPGGDAGAPGTPCTYGPRGTATGGQPGSDVAGGAGGTYDDDFNAVSNGLPGALGVGGSSLNPSGKTAYRGAGGGGGGLYGGGAGGAGIYYSASGGGGSSLVPADGEVAVAANGADAGLSISYDVGPVGDVSVDVAAPILVATGVDSTVVTATAATADEVGVSGLDVSFESTDPGQSFGTVTDNGDGTYSVPLAGSTTSGSATVTATAAGSTSAEDVVGTASVETEGYTVVVEPMSEHLLATGVATRTVTAIAQSASGAPVPGLAVTFASTDTGQTFGPVTAHGDGSYTATLTGSTTAGAATISVAVIGAGAPTLVPATLHSDAYLKPTITARASSSAPVRSGWFRTPVTVTFACGGSLPLTKPCPTPVVLSSNGRDQVVTRTVTDSLGSTASVTSPAVSIDATAPGVSVAGARNGATYKSVRKLVCKGKDALSGVASCKVTTTKQKSKKRTVVRWKATASDRAGNTTTTKGQYAVKKAPKRR
jgi:adhesin/invasin